MSALCIFILVCYLVFGSLCTYMSYSLLTKEERDNNREILDEPFIKWCVLIICSFLYPLFVFYVSLKLFVGFICDKVALLIKRKDEE